MRFRQTPSLGGVPDRPRRRTTAHAAPLALGSAPSVAAAAEPWAAAAGGDAVGFALYAGALAALLLSSLATFAVSRDRAHLAHALMVLGVSAGIVTIALDAAGGVPLAFASFAVAGLSGALFSRRFFETAAGAPRLERAWYAFAAAFALAAAAAFVQPAAAALLVLAAGLLLGVFALVVATLRRGDPAARLYAVAWAAIVAAIALPAVRELGWLGATVPALPAAAGASTLGLLLLSVALAERGRAALRALVQARADALAASEHQLEALQTSAKTLTQALAQRDQDLEAANGRLKDSEARLQSAAHLDPLTGVANRLLLNDRISHGIVRSRRHNCRTAVVLIDLDEFKRVNNEFGREVGDEVLKIAAGRLRGLVREQDTVARPGGDEFVIVLEEVFDPQDVQRVATAAATELAQEFAVQGRIVSLSASVGCAIYPDGGGEPEELLRHAAKLMRRAKRGKGLSRRAEKTASAA